MRNTDVHMCVRSVCVSDESQCVQNTYDEDATQAHAVPFVQQSDHLRSEPPILVNVQIRRTVLTGIGVKTETGNDDRLLEGDGTRDEFLRIHDARSW